MNPGDRLGAYEILEPLGAGGMGEVYRARDPRLDRDVAIKVLPEDFGADAERLARFEREAKLLAKLNHSNIATIHGLADADGVRFIAMECVEGETLAERLATQGRIEVDDALEITRQIAEALEAAHESGIVHRDLKPANIKVTPEGKVKVLDFGLAKAWDLDAASGSAGAGTGDASISPDLSHSPTMMDATRTGVILGTAAYMSPEQTRGKPVDKRSDIWAFGCVLYEMLTGGRAFEGETVSDTMAAILKEEPDFAALPPTMAPAVTGLLRRCLEKDPRQRIRDVGDARLFLDGAFDSPLTGAPAAGVDALALWQRPAPALALAVTLIAVASGLTWLAGSEASNEPPPTTGTAVRHVNVALPDSEPLVFVGEAPFGMGQTALALSDDGRYLVYVGPAEAPAAAAGAAKTTRLFLRDMNDGTIRALADTEGAFAPFFSPNVEWIAFFVDDDLMQISIDGETVRPIERAPDAYGGDWGEDGRIVVITEDSARMRIIAPAESELESEVLTRTGVHAMGAPRWLDAEWVLYTCGLPLHLCAASTITGEIRHISASGPPAAEYAEDDAIHGSMPIYLNSGHLVFSARDSNDIMGVRFDADTMTVSGRAETLIRGVRQENGHADVQFALAANGDAVFAPGEDAMVTRFVWVDRDGNIEPLEFPPRPYGMFSTSHDKRRLSVLVTSRVGQQQLRFLGLDDGSDVPWVDSGMAGERLWPGPFTPDGRSAYAVSQSGDESVILLIDSDRASGADELWRGESVSVVGGRTAADGRLFLQMFPSGAGRLSIDGGQTIRFYGIVEPGRLATLGTALREELSPLVQSPGDVVLGDVSPDGEWFAYTGNEAGSYEVYAVRTSGEGDIERVSESGGETPRWSPSGDGLYYRNGRRWYWVDFDASREGDPFGDSEYLFEGNYVNVLGPEQEVSKDGQRLLLLQPLGENTQSTLNFVINWGAEVTQRLPGS